MKILKAHGLDSGTVANISISQLQQKVERIEKFREEVNMMKAKTLGWKESMDRFATEKEAARAQLSSVEIQFRGMKEKSSAQAKKIEELEARLASELAKAKYEAEKAKAEAERETLEEIHSRGFDLTDEIIKAKEHEADARALASSDDDDDDRSKSGSENGERSDFLVATSIAPACAFTKESASIAKESMELGGKL
ncbi:KNR4/SMI1 homolog [Nicotiana tomentosiformis]|uniref:KNR4/SMI1 homolog n=1 Tax=Nicotiana tomentosiformis TaxID=4098 RepID=UPI00388C963F